ncbi:glycosyl hydrolase family 28-related protein [Paenibacillus pini]|uniref:Rhamnogalacturonase A/B/Epimerase-like pectate lyase domain-containing protein n=1 Tax=Paenibacillus pini JCM 16418 TaxID=1236976 RepID=W7YYX4_9BACL|nr:glycosyl hydrolase family 28-related protein [Paenibacillus pini]GAF07584.1 hypothetical protein JCM16418_1611 [Paenibacillus pini JCM 16418]
MNLNDGVVTTALNRSLKALRNRKGLNVLTTKAVGDGIIDDTNAIQSAIDIAYAEGYEGIYLPIGKYRTTKTLILPNQDRPNTLATQGRGFKIVGDGMYDSGIVYTGNEFAIYSDKNMAETILFQDFYINHRNGSGIHLPQGAHQMFERFFSSSCGEGGYGVLIDGDIADQDKTKGQGSYMVSFRNCRFWEEWGYRGTGVKIINSVLCTEFSNNFFSRTITNRPILELVRCDTVNIKSCAFERTPQSVPVADASKGRTEAMVASESRLANSKITSPLIILDQCHAVSITDSHVEMSFESFVGIKNHSAGILIDGCQLSHYAIIDYDLSNGYVIVVDKDSIYSRDIILGARNHRTQVNHEGGTIGAAYVDPIGCVTVKSHYDYTPYQDLNYLHERRTVPYIGSTGSNLLSNPSFYSLTPNGVPSNLELVDGTWTFSQLPYISGCRIKQIGAKGAKYRLRTRTVESLNKHDFYSFIIVGRNNSGVSNEVYIDIAGDTNDLTYIIPSGNQRFTHIQQIKGQASDIIDIVTYAPLDLTIYAMYIIPNIVTEVPYGSETQSVSKLKSVDITTLSIKLDAVETLPESTWNTRGHIFRRETDGVEDQLFICKRKADGSFYWKEI